VYVVDVQDEERKFSGNGTVSAVSNESEPVFVVGRVKKKFRREILELELRLVKVLHRELRLNGRCLFHL
jgi:hypothetical protein